MMDPLGLTLENFDAIGKYRATDQGQAIDVSGDLDGTRFSGPVELGQTLAAKPAAADCLGAETCTATGPATSRRRRNSRCSTPSRRAFRTGGYHVRDLMRDIVSSDGFRFVAAPAP